MIDHLLTDRMQDRTTAELRENWPDLAENTIFVLYVLNSFFSKSIYIISTDEAT